MDSSHRNQNEHERVGTTRSRTIQEIRSSKKKVIAEEDGMGQTVTVSTVRVFDVMFWVLMISPCSMSVVTTVLPAATPPTP